MKNLAFILCLFLSVTYMSCEKCEQCTTVVTSSSVGIDDQVTTAMFEACGSEIDEAEGTETITTSVAGISVTAISVTSCK